MKLEGLVCIVTGSATGTGAACAIQLAKKGCRVVVNYTKSEKDARQTLDACKAAGTDAIMVKADVAADVDCRALAKAALDKWGRIDALINNAGITKFAAAAWAQSIPSRGTGRPMAADRDRAVRPRAPVRPIRPADRAISDIR